MRMKMKKKMEKERKITTYNDHNAVVVTNALELDSNRNEMRKRSNTKLRVLLLDDQSGHPRAGLIKAVDQR